MHKRRELGLMARSGLGKRFLQLAPCRRQSNPHRVGGSLQATTVRDGYRRLCFAIGKVESVS